MSVVNGRSLPDQAAEILAWIVTAVVGLLVLTQAAGLDGSRLVATAQALTPHLVAVVALPAVVGLWRRWHAVALTSSLVGLGLIVLAIPMVAPPGQPRPVDDATPVRVGAANLLYLNDRIDEVAAALGALDLDVVVLSEFTAEHRAVLDADPLVASFPFREERVGLDAGGVAVWSRFALDVSEPPDTVNYTVDVEVDAPDGAFRLLAVHPPTPVYDFDGWTRDLAVIGEAAEDDTATLLIGDFNASYWHPAFRDLLARGFVDAHMAAGRGFSASWPTDRSFPPFVRLDHALTDAGLVSIDVEDFDIPGSDHAGLVVSVVPAR